MKRRALVSVSDKKGIVELARNLINLGYEIISTGGTAKVLEQAAIPVQPVSQVTGFPEILEGRVKTLHPKIHGGILARRIPDHLQILEEHGILPIDLVVVNLYPFAAAVSKPDISFAEAIENIDIGGPTLIRAAAKNYDEVTVVVNPERYNEIIAHLRERGKVARPLRLELAAEAFCHTAAYDALISAYLTEKTGAASFPKDFILEGQLVQELRYGENPHQKAALYRGRNSQGVAGAVKIQGKELSFNNLADLHAAWELVQEFEEPAAAVIKHNNPCGVAVSGDLRTAYQKAFEADPVSAFGGIVALNRRVDQAVARLLIQTFLEVVIAPGYDPKALEILSEKPNLRVMNMANKQQSEGFEIKKISGGFLVQDQDLGTVQAIQWEWPAGEPVKIQDLEFAWKVVKHVKSNAIVVAKAGIILGIGAGQMNRIGAAELALKQAGTKAQGGVLASDAFFPFRDTVDLAARYEIKAIVQPGGSVKDSESIEACREHGIAMAFTGKRHFKH